jgi:hypothetical protein
VILGCHGSEYEDDSLLGYSAVVSKQTVVSELHVTWLIIALMMELVNVCLLQ